MDPLQVKKIVFPPDVKATWANVLDPLRGPHHALALTAEGEICCGGCCKPFSKRWVSARRFIGHSCHKSGGLGAAFDPGCVGIVSAPAMDFLEDAKETLMTATYGHVRAPPVEDDDEDEDKDAIPPLISPLTGRAKATRMRHRDDTSSADIVDVTEAPASASAAAAAEATASAAPTAAAKKRRT
jgi:hypothetical protein